MPLELDRSEKEEAANDGGLCLVTINSTSWKDRFVSIPVLLPGQKAIENHTAEYDKTSQTAQNYERAKESVVHVVIDEVDTKEFSKFGLMDKELYKELPKEEKEKKRTTSATGFFITSDGWLVTNYHVACLKGKLSAQWPDGRKLDLRKVYENRKIDLAILKVKSDEPVSVGFLPLSPKNEQPGSSLTSVGYPHTWKNLHCSPGTLLETGKRKDYLPHKTSPLLSGTRSTLVIDKNGCHGGPGGSGSPNLTATGEVASINFAGPSPDLEEKPTHSFAIPVSELRRAIKHIPQLKKTFAGI